MALRGSTRITERKNYTPGLKLIGYKGSDGKFGRMRRNDATRIVIADDHPVIRMSLRWLLEIEPRFSVVGEASNGWEAVALVDELEPDAVLLDVNMPWLDGLEAARIVSSRFPKIKIVILTMHDDPAIIRCALQAGACSVLAKGCSREEIIDAIWCNAGKDVIESTTTLSA